MIRIELAGIPVGKARPRFSVRSGFAVAYTPQKSRTYDENLEAAAARVMGGRAPLEGALAVHVFAVFPIPTSWPRKKQLKALSGEIRPCVKPDGDNILKQLDALNGIVFVDDKNIVDARVTKKYGERPRLVVVVSPIGEANHGVAVREKRVDGRENGTTADAVG